MKNTIALSSALKEMDQSITPSGEENPFSISFYKYSKSKKKDNGTLVSYDRCLKHGLPNNMVDMQRKAIKIIETGEFKTLNIFLIDTFNGQKVTC